MADIWQWFTINSIQIVIIGTCILAMIILIWSFLRSRIDKWPAARKKRTSIRSLPIIYRVLEVVALAIIVIAAIAIVLSRQGIHRIVTIDTINEWVVKHGIFILVDILVAYIAYRIVKVILPRIVESSVKARGKGRKARAELARRSETLTEMLIGAVRIVILTIAVFVVLDEAGVPIAPLLAGAGVVGIAIGFGAQHLIRDFLNGLFILTEDQYNRGDVVKVANIAGLVEDINLRRTILRDLDGLVHSIPNGEITTASNYTKGLSRVNLDISVSYLEDLDHVIDVINRVCATMAEDENYKDKILKQLQVLRVSNLGASGIDIKVLGDVKPLTQWEITGELRKRIKKAFDEEGIEIPWPHMKVFFGQEKALAPQICPSCGRLNAPGNNFCSYCGSSIRPPMETIRKPKQKSEEESLPEQ